MCRWLRVVIDIVRFLLAWSSCLISLVISLTYNDLFVFVNILLTWGEKPYTLAAKW